MFWIVISSQPKSQSQTQSKSHCYTNTLKIFLKIGAFFVQGPFWSRSGPGVFVCGDQALNFRPWTSGSSVASLEFYSKFFYLLRYPQKFSFYEFFILKKFIWRKILFTIKIRKFKTLIQTRPWFFEVIWLSEFKFFQYFKRLNFCIFLQRTQESLSENIHSYFWPENFLLNCFRR